MSNVDIATTIARQMGGIPRLSMMIGARQFIAVDKGLRFKFPRPGAGNPNCVTVVLDPSDTYTVTFHSIHGMSFKETASYSGIYFDGLVSLFENETGLYLSL